MSGSVQQPGGKSWAHHQVGDWALRAACRDDDVNPDWWFPSESMRPERMREFWSTDAAKAILVCKRCDVREQCLAYAVRTDERDGIWGGKLPQQRPKAPPSQAVSLDDFAAHGTEAGYKRHQRRNEEPCASCSHGARIASRDRKARYMRQKLLAAQ